MFIMKGLNKPGTRNIDVVNRRGKDGEKVNSLDSQKIDSLLRNSIDNFIYETKDLFQPKGYSSDGIKNNMERNKTEYDSDHAVRNYPPKNANMPRSASQKYNYRQTPISDQDHRIPLGTPVNSGSKRIVHRKNHKMHPTPPHKGFKNIQRNKPENYKYASLLNQQQQFAQDGYYAQGAENHRQIHYHSFNAPRKSDNTADIHVQYPPGVNYPGTHHASYDENAVPSSSQKFMPHVNIPNSSYNHSPEFQNFSEENSMDQKHRIGNHKSPLMKSGKRTMSNDQIYTKKGKKIQYPEGGNTELEYSLNPNSIQSKIHNKRESNQTIQEEQESKSSREEYHKIESAQKSRAESSYPENYEGAPGVDDTVYTTNNGGSLIQKPSPEFSSMQKNTVKQRNMDSFTNQIGDFSKTESPEKNNSQMTFICIKLFEILNRNKIPMKQNPEDSSQDVVIKILEEMTHDLRLK